MISHNLIMTACAFVMAIAWVMLINTLHSFRDVVFDVQNEKVVPHDDFFADVRLFGFWAFITIALMYLICAIKAYSSG